MQNSIVIAGFVVAGLVAGPGLAAVSLRLPRGAPGTAHLRRLRYGGFAVAASALGGWAALSQTTVSAALLTAVLGWGLLLVAVVDAEHHWLPDELTLPLAAAGLGAALLPGGTGLLNAVIGAAAGFVVLWSLAFAYRRVRGRDGLGGGDPVLLAAGGAWVGWMGLPSVLLWAVTAGLCLVLTRVATKSPLAAPDRLAFGACLAIGIWMTWIFGPPGL